MYTSLMLRLCGSRCTEIMVGWGGDGMITFLAHVMCTSLMSVLAALQFYRNDCSRGTVSIQSHQKTNFVPESLTWLD